MKVKECMCNDVCSCMPNATVEEVAKLMNTNHIGCVPICDNKNCVVGLVTDRDIVLRCIACDKDAKKTPISEIMSCDICCCTPDDEVTNAESKMAQNQIRRIPVVDNGKVVGILTMGDLAHFDKDLGEKQVCNTISDICNCEGQTKNDK